tara:strand:+ start:358 stop:981 length:624 start_codon:yes stop_codon:yes gene_type:complete
MKFKHYILTRFAYPDDYPHLKERFELFHRFTKPSFEAQTNTNFIWLIKINPNHKDLYGTFDNIDVVLDPQHNAFQIPTDHVLTSRVDCDDVIHPNYVSNIQELFLKDQSMRVIDGPGYRYTINSNQLWNKNTYHQRRPSPFSTLVCPFETKESVMGKMHDRLHTKYQVQFHNERLWVQIIHDHNKLMKGGGEELTDISYLKSFNINF